MTYKDHIGALIFLLLLFTSISTFGQNTIDVISFPSDWLGTYKGTMYIYTQKLGMVDSVDVTFKLGKTNESRKWKYEMTFNNKRYGKVTKDYRLLRADTLDENIYLLDEQNGIYIQEVLMGNTLYSSFKVAGNQLFSILRNEKDYLEFEIISMRESDSMLSTNEAEEDDQVFEVESFVPFTTQRAFLFRQ